MHPLARRVDLAALGAGTVAAGLAGSGLAWLLYAGYRPDPDNLLAFVDEGMRIVGGAALGLLVASALVALIARGDGTRRFVTATLASVLAFVLVLLPIALGPLDGGGMEPATTALAAVCSFVGALVCGCAGALAGCALGALSSRSL